MRPQKVLIVDDNVDHRIILRFHLRKIRPFTFTDAAHGRAALSHVVRESFDLIFMNLGMPELDGWETIRLIRAFPPPRCDTPIIAFTAYVLPSYEQKAWAVGCDAYIEKPIVDFPRFRRQVEHVLAHSPC